MHDDDEEMDYPKRKKKGLSFGGWKAFLICLIIGIAAGAFLEHSYIEPIISSNAKLLASLENTNTLLNSENKTCLQQLEDSNKKISCPPVKQC